MKQRYTDQRQGQAVRLASAQPVIAAQRQCPQCGNERFMVDWLYTEADVWVGESFTCLTCGHITSVRFSGRTAACGPNAHIGIAGDGLVIYVSD